MPKLIPWSLFKQFLNKQTYLSFKDDDFAFSNKKTNTQNNCTICKSKEHKMRVNYLFCSDTNCNTNNRKCACEYKVCVCLKNSHDGIIVENHYHVYKLNDHVGHKCNPVKRGLTSKVKRVVNDLFLNYDGKPSRIFNQLKRKKYAKKIDRMPTLRQLQYYINYKRYKAGNNDNIDELKNFIGKLSYIEQITPPHKLFVFGESIFECDVENPCYIGFTSENLLRRVEKFKNLGTYHIDATYKIVKYNYPLIVFGFTDLSRQFYPVAFMFVSREKQADFEHFFNSLISVMEYFKISFKPEFIVVDAHYPTANAIAKIFPFTKIIMCWFHVKQNIRKHKNYIKADNYVNILKEINELHNCVNTQSYVVKNI